MTPSGPAKVPLRIVVRNDADADDTGGLEAWRLKIYYGEHPEEDQDGEEETTSTTPEFPAIASLAA